MNVIIEKDVPVPMRDGTRLFADVLRPDRAGRFPVLLQRTPYGKDQIQQSFNMMDPIRAVQAGYVVVIQDVRGRYQSEGEYTPFASEGEDGYDTVEWCAHQPWSNGRIGMYGTSYVGATQWLAACMAPPHLRAIFPVMTAADYYNGWVYQGGALRLAFIAGWVTQFLSVPHLARLGLSPEEYRAEEARLMSALDHLRKTLSHRPLQELPLLNRPGLAPYFFEWLEHPVRDDYWQRWSIEERHEQIQVPAFNLGGWYDLFVSGPVRNYTGLRSRAGTPEARKGQKLLMGPWTHNSPAITTAGERNFGWSAALKLDDLQHRWFDYWLKEIDTGIMSEPPVKFYVMGAGWRDDYEWPPAGTEYVPFYLHSGGRANSLRGDGRLDTKPPGYEPGDIFLYNPYNPVPSLGPGGVFDQRPVEQRDDVLVFSTAPLSEPLEVIGPVTLVLYASSSALDTDFTAKLVDVAADGYARNLCEGIIRARYHQSFAKPELLEPGKPYEFRIDLQDTSNLFLPGHQIRLEISSSNFPRFDTNPNTGEWPAHARTVQSAIQTIYHDADHPSHLLLPVSRRIGR